MRSGSRTQSRPLSRKAKVISIAAGALLTWQIVAISLAASHGDTVDDLSAADYAETSPAAAAAAAERHLQDGDAAGAAVFARHALSESPISASSLRSLGLAEQNLGDLTKASGLFSQSAALGWRDLPTQLWLVQAYLQSKSYPDAAQRMDAALRTAPAANDLYHVLDGLLIDPNFAAAMRGRFEQKPNWRARYFQIISDDSDAELDARAALLSSLTSSSTPPSRDEVLSTVFELVRRRDVRRAKALWFKTRSAPPGALYDPQFNSTGSHGMVAFEWTSMPVLGANMTIRPNDSGQGSTILVTTDGSASGAMLRQTTLIDPGTHHLGYQGNVPANMRHVFGWSIRCAATGRIVLNSLEADAPPPYAFTIPADCDSQIVEMRVGRSPSAAGSSAQFSHVSID